MKNFCEFLLISSCKSLRVDCGESTSPDEQGFTLIELLVVIIIIGVLAAITLPSMLRQVNKAQAAGVKTHLGALNRAQQAYLLKNAEFASTLDDLATGVPQETQFHTYSVQSATSRWTVVEAVPKNLGTVGYAAVVYINDNQISTKICEGRAGSLPSVTFTHSGADWLLSGCDTILP
jgi:type IV pilus assembly protein PilA